jgi:hypothetical protein
LKGDVFMNCPLRKINITLLILVWLSMIVVEFPNSLVTASIQTPVYNPTNGHYYELVPGPITWDAAKAAAESRTYLDLHGHLATITSAQENSFINSNLSITDDNGAWTGGFQPNQGLGLAAAEGWQWVTGEPWSYTNWHPGEPNDFGRPEWVSVIRNDGYWNDLYGTYSHPGGYVVEYDVEGCQDDGSNTVNHHVGGLLRALQQAENTCWATAGAIIYSWKNRRPSREEQVLALLDVPPPPGFSYLDLFRQHEGLNQLQWSGFVSRLGLHQKFLGFPQPCELEAALKESGPILVVTSDEGVPPSPHAQILVGIQGDGSDAGTFVFLIDPAEGRRHQISYASLRFSVVNVPTLWAQWLQYHNDPVSL